jgi:hypothetical protein
MPSCSAGSGWWKRWFCGGVVGMVGGEFDYAVVRAGGWHWADDGYGQAGLIVPALVGEGH